MRNHLKEAGQLIGRGILRAVFGPEVRGYVEQLRRDINDPLTYHVLVRTDEGRLRHFTHSEAISSSNLTINLETGEIDFNKMDEKRGQRWEVRTRGTGVFLLPGSIIERDPFNLKTNG